MSPQPTLGVNAYVHDAGLAWIDPEASQVLSIEEERLDRIKSTRAFPERAIALLRGRYGIALRDAHEVVLPWHVGRFARTVARLVFESFPPAFRLLTPKASPHANLPAVVRMLLVGRALAAAFGEGGVRRVRFVPHHLAHACTAYFLSPFDRAAVLVMDAYGDECSTSTYRAQGPSLERLTANSLWDSIGILYAIVTRHLGHRTILDEGKVMALAAFGDDSLYEPFSRLVQRGRDGAYTLDRAFFSFERYGEARPLSEAFIRRFGPPRHPSEPLTDHHRNLARALQRTTEDAVLHVLRHLHESTGEENLCLGGGVALNCVANGRILRETGFRRVYVPPNPSDSGVALGAALARTHLGQSERLPVGKAMDSQGADPFLGPSYSDGELAEALKTAGLDFKPQSDVARFAARELAAGRIVAWFQGAAEAGPRALGNRSILADPRDPQIAPRLNGEIKKRELYRPFGPSVLSECAGEFFEDLPASPYMSFAAPVRPGKREQVPAVVAHDGTARVQTVTSESRSRFRALIEAFHEMTGIPLVLNTSFNVQEPTVATPEDAAATFLRSSIDTLVMGPFVATR